MANNKVKYQTKLAKNLLFLVNTYLSCIQLCGSQLVSASYDCTVVVSTLPGNLVQEITTSSSTSTNPLKSVTEEEVKQVSTVQVDLESFSCQI